MYSKQNDGRADIQAVELLGEVTRYSVFRQIIKENFNIAELKRTMHSQEFLSKGATIYGVWKQTGGKDGLINFDFESYRKEI